MGTEIINCFIELINSVTEGLFFFFGEASEIYVMKLVADESSETFY